MDIINHLVLAWLEEDNQKLGHFRARPLLRETGPFTPAEIGELRDDGYIRIVPDKSEQRSCKERMRTLGGFCLLKLTGAHADKFKQNKNYSPAKGEKNRYIVYSNAVEPLPENLFYEVIPESMLARAVTAQVYARLGGKIHGPVDRQTGRDLKDACQLPPDDPRIFSVTLPDGTVRLFYWPVAEEKAPEAAPDGPEAAPQAAEEPAAEEAEPMTALDQIKALDQQMLRMVRDAENPEAAEKPKDVLIADDAGTPLYYAQMETEEPRRHRNSLAQAVESNRRTDGKQAKTPEKKKAAPEQKQERPAEPEKPAPAAQPFEALLKEQWAQAQDRQALARQILALPGAKKQFAQVLGGADDPVLAALKAQLQDTEAERLMTVMNLNQAKAQEAQYRESLIEGLVNSERQGLDALREDIAVAADELKTLKEQQAKLLHDQERFDQKTMGYRPVWPGEASEDVPVMTAVHRVMESLRTAGFECSLNQAVALLALYSFNGRSGICMAAQNASDSSDAAEALAHALGGAAVDGGADICVIHGGNAALLLLKHNAFPFVSPSEDYACVYVNTSAMDECDGISPVPVIRFQQSGTMPGIPAAFSALDCRQLRGRMQQTRTPLNQKALDIISRMRSVCADKGIVIPLAAVRDITAFAEAAQNLMEGGISAALDWAFLTYAVPMIRKNAETAGFLRDLTKSLPLTRAALELK